MSLQKGEQYWSSCSCRALNPWPLNYKPDASPFRPPALFIAAVYCYLIYLLLLLGMLVTQKQDEKKVKDEVHKEKDRSRKRKPVADKVSDLFVSLTLNAKC